MRCTVANHKNTKINRTLGKSGNDFRIQKNLKYIRQLGKFGEARTEAELDRVMPYSSDKEQAHGNLRPDFAVNDKNGRRLGFVETKQGDRVNARDWKQLRGDVRLAALMTRHRILVLAVKGGEQFFHKDKSGKGVLKLKALTRYAARRYGVRIVIIDTEKQGFGSKIKAAFQQRRVDLRAHRDKLKTRLGGRIKTQMRRAYRAALKDAKGDGARTGEIKGEFRREFKNQLRARLKEAAQKLLAKLVKRAERDSKQEAARKPPSAAKKGSGGTASKPPSAVKKGISASGGKPPSTVKKGATLKAKPPSAVKPAAPSRGSSAKSSNSPATNTPRIPPAGGAGGKGK